MAAAAEKSNNGTLAHYNAGIHRLAQVVAAWAFVVILYGGKTKSKEAGLTIPEPFIIKWIPEWFSVENLSAEYTHRVAVGLLSCLMLSLFIWTMISGQKLARTLAAAALSVLLAQAVLGAMTVYFMARAHTSIPHAVLGQTFFALAISIAVVTSRQWLGPAKPALDAGATTLRRLSVCLIIAMFVQLLLGAALRHDEKGEALRNGNTYIFVTHLMAHIGGALVVTYYMARAILRVFREFRDRKELLAPVRLMMMLLGIQLMLGAGAAVLKVLHASYEEANSPPPLRVVIATSHLAIGALILGSTVVLALRAYRFTVPTTEQNALSNNSTALGVPA